MIHLRSDLFFLKSGVLMTVICCSASQGLALNGNNSVNLTAMNGWEAFELVTQNDNISDISDSGYGDIASRGLYDGLGAYVSGNTLSVFINHEISSAAISRLDLDLNRFKQAINHSINNGTTSFPSSIATGMGYAYDAIYDGSYHAITNASPVASGTVAVGNYSNSNFVNFCSGSSYLADAFGAGRGFVDEIYITGEETFDTTGKFVALDSATATLWEVPDFGVGTLTVTGPVPSFYAKQLVQESLLVIDGVQRIDNRVDVVYPTHKRSALGSTLSRSRRSSDFCDPRTAV
jgi:hypothetical protein